MILRGLPLIYGNDRRQFRRFGKNKPTNRCAFCAEFRPQSRNDQSLHWQTNQSSFPPHGASTAKAAHRKEKRNSNASDRAVRRIPPGVSYRSFLEHSTSLNAQCNSRRFQHCREPAETREYKNGNTHL